MTSPFRKYPLTETTVDHDTGTSRKLAGFSSRGPKAGERVPWRQKYGGMSPDMIKQLWALQEEIVRLKKLVADQALDNGECQAASMPLS
jgi:hypothetical protein